MSAPPKMSRTAVVGICLFTAAVLVHLAMLLFGVTAPALRVSQGSLMLTLAVWAFAPLPGGRRMPWVTAVPLALALACSWLGDVAPGFLTGDPGFLAMVIAFSVAQVCWIVTMWPWRQQSIAARQWPFVLAYAGMAISVLILTAPGAGPLAAAIIPYAGLIAFMGLLATGLGWRGAFGGLLFIVSDAMIAVFTFAPLLEPDEPQRSMAIMATYCLAQGLLVAGVRSRFVLALVAAERETGHRLRGDPKPHDAVEERPRSKPAAKPRS